MKCPKCRRRGGWVHEVSASAAGASYECGWCHHAWRVLPKAIRDMIAGYERALTMLADARDMRGWPSHKDYDAIAERALKAARTLRRKAEGKEDRP